MKGCSGLRRRRVVEWLKVDVGDVVLETKDLTKDALFVLVWRVRALIANLVDDASLMEFLTR